MTNKIDAHRAEIHAPARVLEERERRRAAVLQQDDIAVLMGEPPPGYSALDAHRRAEDEAEAAERERIRQRQQANRAGPLTATLRRRQCGFSI
jgi:hypothetical protein